MSLTSTAAAAPDTARPQAQAWVDAFSAALSARDATAGFRAYRAPLLARLLQESPASQGYCFQVDMTWRVHRLGGRIVEVPISFVERAEGTSKMSQRIVVEALLRTTAWGAKHRAEQVRGLVRRRQTELT